MLLSVATKQMQDSIMTWDWRKH